MGRSLVYPFVILCSFHPAYSHGNKDLPFLVANEILLYHKGSFRLLDQLDCNMRKLTVGRSIALLIQSLDCYKGASDFVGNYISPSTPATPH